MKVLGIDPDMHHAGLALMDCGKILAVRVAKVPSRVTGEAAVVQFASAMYVVLAELVSDFPGIQRVVVESQELSMRRIREENIKPQGIINLGQTAGTTVGIVRCLLPGARIDMPRPIGSKREPGWKPSIPKHAHQKRILSAVGIPYEPGKIPTRILRVPDFNGAADISASNWLHVIDAIGLAMHGGG